MRAGTLSGLNRRETSSLDEEAWAAQLKSRVRGVGCAMTIGDILRHGPAPARLLDVLEAMWPEMPACHTPSQLPQEVARWLACMVEVVDAAGAGGLDLCARAAGLLATAWTGGVAAVPEDLPCGETGHAWLRGWVDAFARIVQQAPLDSIRADDGICRVMLEALLPYPRRLRPQDAQPLLDAIGIHAPDWLEDFKARMELSNRQTSGKRARESNQRDTKRRRTDSFSGIPSHVLVTSPGLPEDAKRSLLRQGRLGLGPSDDSAWWAGHLTRPPSSRHGVPSTDGVMVCLPGGSPWSPLDAASEQLRECPLLCTPSGMAEWARAVQRWIDMAEREIAQRGSIPLAVLMLLDRVWQKVIAPSRRVLQSRPTGRLAWRALCTTWIRTALAAPVKADQRLASDWLLRLSSRSTSMCIDPEDAFDLLRQSLPLLPGTEVKRALVGLLLPFVRNRPHPTDDESTWVELLIVLLRDPDLQERPCGGHSWVEEMRQLCAPVSLGAASAFKVLTACACRENELATRQLMAWLWPLITPPDTPHPALTWLVEHPWLLAAISTLPSGPAIHCLALLAAECPRWSTPAPMEAAWCQLYGALKARADLGEADCLLLATWEGRFDDHPMVAAHRAESDRAMDPIDWAVWNGLRGRPLFKVIRRVLQTPEGAAGWKARLDERHAVQPTDPAATVGWTTLPPLLGKALSTALGLEMRQRERLAAPAMAGADEHPPGHTPNETVEIADAQAAATVSIMIASDVKGRDLAAFMLELVSDGKASMAQLARWTSQEGMRERLGAVSHDILENIVMEAVAFAASRLGWQ